MRALLIVVLGLTSSSALVRADAISEPPSCPEHSEPDFCHGPPTCAPRECLSSRDCELGERCAVVNLCTEEHSCGGWGTGEARTHVLGLCGPGDSCSEGTCSGQFVCVPGGTEVRDAGIVRDASRADASGTDAGDGRTHARYGCDCQCAVGASRHRGAAPWLLFPLGMALLGWASRRRGN